MLGRLFSRKNGPEPSGQAVLDRPLFHWSPKDPFSTRIACEHVLAVGASGSGKTSGPGRLVSRSYLLAGFGGLVMTAKDDRAMWQELCRSTGRERDLVIWGPDYPEQSFNFLDWEVSRPSRGAGYSENVLQVIEQAVEVAARGDGADGGRDAPYWRNSRHQLLRAVIDTLTMAGRPLSIRNIMQVIVTAPRSRAEMLSKEWSAKSYCYECLIAAQERADSEEKRNDFESVEDYWFGDFAELGDRTRPSVVSCVTSVLDVLTRGPLRRLLCTSTTLTPDMMEQGKIVLLDMPLPQYGALGQIGQQIMKFSFFQKSMERRDVAASPRPVFLHIDEAQFFVSSYDMLFLSTCRSSRVANVYLTQNINNLYAALSGHKAQAEANSILGNFGTKIMLANSDHVTNEWQANLIGRQVKLMLNGSNSRTGADWAMAALGLGHAGDTSAGFSEQVQYEVEPAEFSRLKTGGPANNGIVQGIVFQNGRRFAASGRSWLLVDFKQES